MKYMLMLFEPDTDWQSAPKRELDAVLAEHTTFAERLQERGIQFSGEALRPSTTATTLRPDGDDVLVTDGPYVELKENLAGYYMIDVKDLDEALEVARMCPIASGIEVRPVWDTTG
ncbi:YciI family protein [Phytoactinopolyspora endophytica]|uniref:YciI family protein n=1 Tax=Phytoactinopolyspora endophytica TaxID=1642495 RepID=UPI00101C6969|nr:YciI family protein [Phytoactinopolyspora endophytica]